MTVSTFATAGCVVFGDGCAASIGEHARRLGARRVVLITDAGVAGAGLAESVAGWLRTAGLAVAICADAMPEPEADLLDALAAKVAAMEPEALVGLGGGSALDCTKATAVLLTNGGALRDYLGPDLVRRRGLPTILAPTTAGTGSEVTPNAVFAVPEAHTKQVIVSRLILPDVALVDPLLTHSAPARVSAASGMDALCHAIEAYTSGSGNPLVDPYALSAVALIARHLRAAVHDGADAAARRGMALGSLHAGLALANSPMNAVHALAYPLQGWHHVPHGLANAMLLAPIVAFNASGAPDRFTEIARAMGADVSGLSPVAAADAAADACQRLARDVGIPQRLREVGIGAEHIPALVEGALQVSRLLRNNPRPIDAADIEAIYRQVL